MDKFAEFHYLLLDASSLEGASRAPAAVTACNERVDVVARQFRDFLRRPASADGRPVGMMMTHDFKVRGHATRASGWLSFHVDRGDGITESLEEVAVVAFARDDDSEVKKLLGRFPGVKEVSPPPTPCAVAVLLKRPVPGIVSDFLTKVAAGFFSEDF